MIGLTNLSNRNAWIKEQLISIPAGKRILDAGAGELQWKESCSHLQYVSQDLAQYDGKGDGKGLQCKGWNGMRVDIICDIIDIPEPDNSFDVILCSEVLDHVPNPVAAILELRRLLKSGGTMLLTESFCGLTNQSPYFYYTGLSENFYRHWLYDFDVQVLYNGNYYEWMAQEIWRLTSWGKINTSLRDVILSALEIGSKEHPESYQVLSFGLLVKAIKNV